ncbi:MAG: hypothetical protein AB1428_07695 [Bacteroidota bacterium]
MKTAMAIVALAFSLQATAGEIIVQKIRGDVSVRHGVTEVWSRVAQGDVLKPDDTMKTGAKGSAVLVTTAEENYSGARKTITLPAEVIVDLSDIRELSQEELMLKLTMEKVRASSYQWKNEELRIPNAAAVHGSDLSPSALKESDSAIGILQMNGARVLFDNGFYATCALKGLEVFRRYPTLGTEFRNRLLVAQALEKAELRGEALGEYGALSTMEGLTPEQQGIVKGKMQALRR